MVLTALDSASFQITARHGGFSDSTDPFNSLPNEIIEHVGFFTATLGPLGPPKDIIALQLVCRRFATVLSSRTNPHFYVSLFKAKFDSDAYYKRLGPEATRPENVARELKRRFMSLKRFRTMQHCFVQIQQAQPVSPLAPMSMLSPGHLSPPLSPSPSLAHSASPFPSPFRHQPSPLTSSEAFNSVGTSNAAEETLKTKEMLWIAYLMMLENDGLNDRVLKDYARLDVWLRNFWFDSEGASCATYATRDNLWPPNMEFSVLAMWLFWFTLEPRTSPFHLLSLSLFCFLYDVC